MLADLERLIELQQVDFRLRELSRQIEEFPGRRKQAEAELARARDELARHRSAHTESLKARKKLELDVQQFEERIHKHRGQMYEVKSNEAYRALQHEAEEEERQKAAAEDKVLEAMIAAEEEEKAIRAAEVALKEVEARVAAGLRELDSMQKSLETESAELRAQRDTLRAGVDEDMLEMYDRIAGGHGGIALAEARDEVCQVCRIHIRPQTFAEVKRNDQVHTCESCHRILYYVPAPPPSPSVVGQAVHTISQADFAQFRELQIKHRWDWPAVFSTNEHAELWAWTVYGYTQPADREHVRGLSPVLDKVADEYLSVRAEGGRFFIDERGAFYKDESGQQVQFVSFRIPELASSQPAGN